ncbi:auxin-responsive protein SAUR32 [Senna tora]|uniref:Auxin-responsive protein SAUR32 n=1 Tax=Senna tora TaxID=362788 RepID=A0A834T7C7_9FABA|nr:auxin-responsive protein SAUR32 [Senna tora]
MINTNNHHQKHHLMNFHVLKPHLHFHLFHFHHHKDVKGKGNNIPKGCLAILVGQEGEEQERFVIPVVYFNHPLFIHLLKQAEEEYGFDHKGPIAIPCHVDHFRTVQGLIDKDNSHHHHHHAWTTGQDRVEPVKGTVGI